MLANRSSSNGNLYLASLALVDILEDHFTIIIDANSKVADQTFKFHTELPYTTRSARDGLIWC